ncbi:hypothetical protein ACIQ7Q_26525 [Streptomyces sp. NPDC096176]|uniref:hypothetical protein n=1 Tax=Streptomyces sp. NPDC096176 TaxID=3366079 RepID=UPI0037FC5BE7
MVDGLIGAAVAVAAIGIAVAPHLTAVFGLAERVAPLERMGEAMAFLGSGLIIGQGAAALAAGRLADRSGFGAAFACSCAAGLVAVTVAMTQVRPRTFAPADVPPPLAAAGGVR